MRRLFGSRLEVAFTAGLLLWAAAEAALIESDWPVGVRLAFALAATAPLALRHRHPYAVALWAVVVIQIDGLVTFLPYTAVTPLEGIAVGMFAIAAYGAPRRRAALALGASSVVPFLFLLTEREVPVTRHDLLVFALMQLLAVAAGWFMRLRREEAEQAAALARRAGAEQAALLAHGLAAERRRIAHELHAIVTRDLSAIARLAEVARRRLADTPADALDALAAISGTTTSALDELRRLLHVLLGDDAAGTAATTAVAPGGAASAGVPPAVPGEPSRRRAFAVDAAIALLALAALAAEQVIHSTGAVGWISGLALIVVPLAALRSRAGFLTACLLAVGGLWGRTMLGWMPPAGTSLVAVLAFAPFAAAAFARDDRGAVAGGLVCGAFGLAALAWIPDRVWTDLPIVVCTVALSWTAGWSVRGSSRQTFAQRLDRLRRAEATPARLAAALDAERRRVARDLHDAVANGISLVGLLAAGARATAPRDPARARATLDDLDAAIATTRVELARLLEALRAGETPAEQLASVGDLDAIVAAAVRCGQAVELELERETLSTAPVAVRSATCRIVQEALTNARKHAPGTAVRVSVRATRPGDVDGPGLAVAVRNGADPGTIRAGRGSAGPSRGTGRGIEGMRERALLLGGALDAAPAAAGGFAVRAWLPLEEARELPDAGVDDAASGAAAVALAH